MLELLFLRLVMRDVTVIHMESSEGGSEQDIRDSACNTNVRKLMTYCDMSQKYFNGEIWIHLKTFTSSKKSSAILNRESMSMSSLRF